MKRRQVLQQFAGGSLFLTAGCSYFDEEPGPFRFAIVNRREQQYHAEFTIWDGDGDIIRDGVVDIAARPPGDGEFTALTFDNLPKVTNGDAIDVRITIDGETFEETYEVTCNRSETAENNFFFRIRRPDAPTDAGNGMEFGGSEC